MPAAPDPPQFCERAAGFERNSSKPLDYDRHPPPHSRTGCPTGHPLFRHWLVGPCSGPSWHHGIMHEVLSDEEDSFAWPEVRALDMNGGRLVPS